MKAKRISLGDINGRLAFASFKPDIGYTAFYTGGTVGPFSKRAKEAICNLIDAEILYNSRCLRALVLDNEKWHIPYFKKFPTFKKSPEYRAVFEKYKLPAPE